MGKSNKKVKNERINSIRKQYDAFLEEDKKRKERNEYILGKLNKMRSSMMLVPISTKANYHLESNHYGLCMRPDNLSNKILVYNYGSQLDRQKLSTNVNAVVDETTVLKELRKNYILIPKRKSTAEKDNIYRNEVNDENDWKSKYNILYDLKNQEKEGQSDVMFQENNGKSLSGREGIKAFKSIIPDKPFSDFDHFDEEAPSKDLRQTRENKSYTSPERLFNNDNREDLKESQSSKNHVINKINHPQENVTEKEKYNADINEKNENYLMENIENLEVNKGNLHIQAENQENLNFEHEKTVEIDKNTNGCGDNSKKTSLSGLSQEPTKKEFSETNDFHDRKSVNEKDANEMLDLINKEKVQEEIGNNPKNDTLNKRNVGNTNETCHETQNNLPVTPVAPPESDELYDNANPEYRDQSNENNYDAAQHYQATEEGIPTMLEDASQLEHLNHDTEINAFEAEQNEMFYSEQTGGGAYEYNAGDANNEEYNGETYQQNDQYAYYEGVQEEYANIEEHEESTQRYDPHYDQQYEGTYENQQPVNYENTSDYVEQQYIDGNYAEHPQFDNTVSYDDNQPDNSNLYETENISKENDMQGNILVPQENQLYDQQIYSEMKDTQEHIEQQLVTEESGYTGNAENEINTELSNSNTTRVEA